MHWPTLTVLQTLTFVEGLFGKDSKLEAMLSTEDCVADGVYRPDIDDPQLCNPFGAPLWELYAMRDSHCDVRVREASGKLMDLKQ
jgi:nucleolar complex protein 3